MRSTSKDKAKGEMHQGECKIMDLLRETLGTRNLEAAAKNENLNGKIQEKIGKIKKVANK